MAEYREAGKKIDVTATAALTYHIPVVVGTLLAIPSKSAAIGETVSCDVDGVYEIVKKADEVITQGAEVFWLNGEALAATTTGAISCGVAWKAAAAADANVLVKIN